MYTVKIFEADKSGIAITPVSQEVQQHLEQNQITCWDDGTGLLMIELEGRKAEDITDLLRQGGFQFTVQFVPAPKPIPGRSTASLTAMPAVRLEPHLFYARKPPEDDSFHDIT